MRYAPPLAAALACVAAASAAASANANANANADANAASRRAQAGFFDANGDWVDPSCMDLDASCGSWSRSGECERNPGFMSTSCAMACGICKAAPPPTAGPAPRPTSFFDPPPAPEPFGPAVPPAPFGGGGGGPQQPPPVFPAPTFYATPAPSQRPSRRPTLPTGTSYLKYLGDSVPYVLGLCEGDCDNDAVSCRTCVNPFPLFHAHARIHAAVAVAVAVAVFVVDLVPAGMMHVPYSSLVSSLTLSTSFA